MNRGNLAEDPRAGLPSSSRYSRTGSEENKLLYVDVRGRRGKATGQGNGRAAEGNYNFKAKRSVGRSLADSHMDRLEVGSDGRLFGVKENPSRTTAPKQEVKKTGTVQPPIVQTEAFREAGAGVKPARDYLAQQENPLLKKKKSSVRRSTAPEARQVQAKAPGRGPASAGLSVPVIGKKWRIPLLAAIAAAAVAGYSYTAWHFRNRFYPGTEFFGIKAVNMSVYDVKAAIREKVNSYELALITRNPNTSTEGDTTEYVIKATDIDMIFADDEQVDRAMQAQKSWLWPVMMIAQNLRSADDTLETQYDRDMAVAVLEDLACFDEDTAIAPQNARVALTDDGAVVETEVYGTTLDREAAEEAILEALDYGLTTLDLDQQGLYENPTVFWGDLGLLNEAQELNLVLGTKVTMPFGDRQEVINSEVVCTFLDEVDGAYRVNEDKVRAYVDNLAKKYDTYGTERTFYTSIGTRVELDGSGDYGWELDRETMKAELLDAVLNRKVMTLEPVYTREAYCRSANDLGDTYVEINITDQMMWFYKEGRLIVKTPVVTGNPYAGNATPSGSVWSIKGRYRNQLLSGEDYSSPVDYWMPFNGGVGIHDLQNRWYFGGNVYLGGGSHGCVNTPLSAVKLVYANIEAGVPVIVYEDESETAQSLMTGPIDASTINAEVEETYGTVEDDGVGSIVYWTAQQKAAGTAAAQSGGTWQ